MGNEIREIQELILAVHSLWHFKVDRQIKQLMDSGISLETYYCLQTVRFYQNGINMTDLAHWMNIPKQQLTKLVNRLVELGFVTRGSDPKDRRVIIIHATKSADDYIESFLNNNMEVFGNMAKNMEDNDRSDFKKALETLEKILMK